MAPPSKLWWLEKTAATKEQLLAAGSCCGQGCYNCPYEPKHQAGATTVRSDNKKSDSVLSHLGLDSKPL